MHGGNMLDITDAARREQRQYRWACFVALALSIASILASIVAFWMKRSVYEEHRAIWDLTDSAPHMFAIGITHIFRVLPWLACGAVLNLVSFCVYWSTCRRANWPYTALLVALWSAW